MYIKSSGTNTHGDLSPCLLISGVFLKFYASLSFSHTIVLISTTVKLTCRYYSLFETDKIQEKNTLQKKCLADKQCCVFLI